MKDRLAELSAQLAALDLERGKLLSKQADLVRLIKENRAARECIRAAIEAEIARSLPR